MIEGIHGLAKCVATHLIALSTEQMTLLRCDAVLLTLHVSRTKLTFLITVTDTSDKIKQDSGHAATHTV